MAQQSNRTGGPLNVLKPANNLRIQWLGAFVVAVLFTALITSLSSAWIAFQNGRERIERELALIANLTEAEIDVWIENLRIDLAALAVPQEVQLDMQFLLLPTSAQELRANELRQVFTDQINMTGRFDEIFVINTEGQILVSTNQANEGVELNAVPFLTGGRQGIYLQPPRYLPEFDAVSVIVALPVVNQGDVLGVLAGRADLDAINKITTERSRFGQTGESYLVGPDYNLLTNVRSAAYTPLETNVNSSGAESVLNNQIDGAGVYTNYRDATVVGVYRWLPNLQTALLVEQEQTEAFQSIYATLLVNFAVALGAALVALVIAGFLIRNITQPIRKLGETATQFAAGNFSLRADTGRNDEIGNLAQAFNQMADRLAEFIETLEERVRERTRALETGAEVGRQIVTLRDIDRLLQFVVDRLQTEFDFYHTHIYLVDEQSGEAVLAQGYGEVGRKLKRQDHRLKLGEGIVGTVAQTNERFVSNDVDQAPFFVRNPLLPDTNSELAVPLRRGDTVLGVLDIQSDQFDRFSPEDVEAVQAIANQTAVALENARLLGKTQSALMQVERLNRRLTRENWQAFKQEMPIVGYHFKQGQTAPLKQNSEVWLSPMQQAAETQQVAKQTNPSNGEPGASELAVPLVLRNQVIGVLGVRRKEQLTWAEEERQAVEAVAGQVARALENARLSKEQEKTIEQLKEVDRLKSEFLTSMSHELRTPLNSIIGFADVLLQGIDGELNEIAMNDIQLIYNSGQHLLALINDILDLSKIEAEKMELTLQPVDIKEVVQDVLSASNSLLKKKPIEVSVEIEDGLPPVEADKLRLTQVLLNLVSNAAKFTEEGDITIKARVSDDVPNQVRIAIIDTGIGIPKEKQDAIFDRFRQADSSTTRRYGGTGLGLAICRKLVELHGGEIGVVSTAGEGSEFYFTIPLAE